MAIDTLIAKASDPLFYQKVGFIALKVAQDVASEPDTTDEHAARLAFAQMILRGEDRLPLLAMHVVAANATLQSTIDAGDEPSDGDLEFVLASIWTARARAFAAA